MVTKTEPGDLQLLYREEALRCILSLAAGWPLQPDDAVFINGSRIEGLANVKSDVDAWLVTRDEDAGLAFVPIHDWSTGQHVNMVGYSYAQLSALAAKVNSIDPGDHATVCELPLGLLERYYRVASAYPVINKPAVQRLKQDFRLTVIGPLVSAFFAVTAARCLLGVEVHRSLGKTRQSLTWAKAAVASALDSYLAAHGDANPAGKYRFEKLARMHGMASALYARVWELKDCGEREPAAYFEAAQGLCHELGVGECPGLTLTPRQSMDTVAFGWNDASLIVHRHLDAHLVSPLVRRVFDLADGSRTMAAIEAALGREEGVPAGEAGRLTRDAINILEQRRLVTWPWPWNA